MADGPEIPDVGAEAVVEPVVAPVEAVPVAVEAVAEAAPVEAEVEAPAEEAKPEPSAVEGEAAPVAEPEVKAPDAAEAKPEGEAAPAEAEPLKYEAFKLPEGFTAQPEQIESFTGLIGKYGVPQEAAQELMDLHAGALQKAADAMAQHQQDVFAETRRGWVQDFEKTAGNRRDTILNDAKFAITDTIKDAKEREALWNVLAFTGAGDNPAVINAMAKMGRRLRERSAPAQGLPARAQPNNPADRRYGSQPKR